MNRAPERICLVGETSGANRANGESVIGTALKSSTHRRCLAALALLSIGVVAGTARAEDASKTAAPPAASATPASPSAAPPSLTPRPLPAVGPEKHHGLYLRLSGGYGGQWISSTGGPAHTDGRTSIAGSAGALDVMVGARVTRGLYLGGGTVFHFAVSPTLKIKGDTGNLYPKPPSTIGSLIVGPMIDIYPDPSSGFHFGGLVGLAGMNLKDAHNRGSIGAGAALWAGYMWPVSPNWSVGGLARVSAAWTGRTVDDPTSGSAFKVTDSSRTATLMFSAAFR